MSPEEQLQRVTAAYETALRELTVSGISAEATFHLAGAATQLLALKDHLVLRLELEAPPPPPRSLAAKIRELDGREP